MIADRIGEIDSGVASQVRDILIGQQSAGSFNNTARAQSCDVDLEKLGVPLGHRKCLLRAISGLAAAETGITRANPVRSSSSRMIVSMPRTRSRSALYHRSDRSALVPPARQTE